MRKYTDKEIEKVSGAIASSFETLHYLEECKKLGIFHREAKQNVNRTLKDLIYIEKTFYDQVVKIDEDDLSDKLMANKLGFLDWLLNKFSLNDRKKLEEVCVAFSIDNKRLCGISDKIHLENGAKKLK